MQPAVFGPECLLTLNVLWVNGDARHRTDLDTLRLVKMPDTLGAFGRVNFVNLLAQIDRLVRAFGLAYIAIDAFVGDHQSHVLGSTGVAFGFMSPIIGQALRPAQRQGCWQGLE